jgi:hypothetical protein
MGSPDNNEQRNIKNKNQSKPISGLARQSRLPSHRGARTSISLRHR